MSTDALLVLLAALAPPVAFVAVGWVAAFALAGLLFAMRDWSFWRALRSGLGTLLSLLTAAVLLAMIVLSGLQIVMRNAAESGFLWIDPLLRHLVLVLAVLGALAATGKKRHIHIDVVGRLLRGRAARVCGALIAALGTAVCLGLAHASLMLLAEEIPVAETAFLSVPTSAVIAVFPFAFLGMALRLALLAFEEAFELAPPTDAPPIDLEGVA